METGAPETDAHDEATEVSASKNDTHPRTQLALLQREMSLHAEELEIIHENRRILDIKLGELKQGKSFEGDIDIKKLQQDRASLEVDEKQLTSSLLATNKLLVSFRKQVSFEIYNGQVASAAEVAEIVEIETTGGGASTDKIDQPATRKRQRSSDEESCKKVEHDGIFALFI
jgi:hypothetical protein